MKIVAWLLVAVAVGVLGMGIAVTIALVDTYGFGAGTLGMIPVAVAFASIPAGAAGLLLTRDRGRKPAGRGGRSGAPSGPDRLLIAGLLLTSVGVLTLFVGGGAPTTFVPSGIGFVLMLTGFNRMRQARRV